MSSAAGGTRSKHDYEKNVSDLAQKSRQKRNDDGVKAQMSVIKQNENSITLLIILMGKIRIW